MYSLAILCLLVPFIAAESSPLSRNRFKLMYTFGANNSSRIVGGVPATDGQIRYIISLRYTNGGSHFCGGSIVSERSIVTAAHCVDGDSASQLAIRYNTLLHNSGGTLVNVASLFMHEQYDPYEIDNDVAVLNLAAALDLSLPNAGSVSLPDQGQDPVEGADVTVSGWGTLSEGSGSLPTALQVVNVPIVGRPKCNTQYASFGGITDQMICAGVDEGGKDACQGDSGGPLVGQVNGVNVLWGATSWGYGCARANYAGVYTRVGIFVNWIRERIIE